MINLSADIPQDSRKWRNYPEIYEWCRQHTLLSETEHRKWLERIETDNSIKMYGIHKNAQPVGVCGFTSINLINRSAEFSLYIGLPFQGHGFGREALHRLLEHGFNEFGFNRIWGETFDKNPAVKTFEKIGMKKEGTLRQSYFKNGKFIDSHIYSILASEFFAKL